MTVVRLSLIHRISGRTYQAADEAIRPAVTPLGDPGAVIPGAAGPSAGEANGAAQVEEAPVI